MKEQGILDRIHTLYREILGDKLVGIYIHGSLALGCFCWERSDIDFLAVVDQSLSQLEKEAIIRALLDLDKDCPPKGLEMSYSGEGAFSESEEAARRFAAYLLEQIVEESKNRS